MKKLLLIFLMATCYGYAEEENVNSVYKFQLIVNAGIGFAHGGGKWGNYFDESIVYLLGAEIPIIKSNKLSLEIETHFWSGQLSLDTVHDWEKSFMSVYYYQLKDNSYCQYGFSPTLKYYLIGNALSNFGISIHFGTMFTLMKDKYNSMDIGCQIKYQMNDDFFIGIDYRNLLKFSIDLGGGGVMDMAPNILAVQFLYNLK